jgi:hypothetical protein
MYYLLKIIERSELILKHILYSVKVMMSMDFINDLFKLAA